MPVLMKCGHASQAVDEKGRPACVICMCTEVETKVPDLTGRKARCSYFSQTFMHNGRRVKCTGETNSRESLPFFEHKPNSKYDTYYCGCWGWD